MTGFYTYGNESVAPQDGFMHFTVTLDASNGVVQGDGRDSHGTFSCIGIYIGAEISFIKQYSDSNGNVAWKYAGKKIGQDGNALRFSGAWGDGFTQLGQWVLSAFDITSGSDHEASYDGGLVAYSSTEPSHTAELTKPSQLKGQWTGWYAYPPLPATIERYMTITIEADSGSTTEFYGSGYVRDGTFTSTGTIESDNKVTFTKQQGSKESVYAGVFFPLNRKMIGLWNVPPSEAQGTFDLIKGRSISYAEASSLMPSSTEVFGSLAGEDVKKAVVAAVEAAGPAFDEKVGAQLLEGFSKIK